MISAETPPLTAEQAQEAYAWLTRNVLLSDRSALSERLRELAPPAGEARGYKTQGRQQEAAAREMFGTIREADHNLGVINRYMTQEGTEAAGIQPGLTESVLFNQTGAWRGVIAELRREMESLGFKDTSWEQTTG